MMENFPMPFIPAAELAPLLKGSHQETASRLDAEIQSDLARFGGKSASVVATFDTHALVMSESGDVYRVGYETSNSGKIYLTTQESLPITVVTDKNLRQYVRTEAKAAADLFLKGLVTQANARIAALFPLMDASLAATDDEIISSFVESRQAHHDWKELIEAREEQIQAYLSEEALPKPLQPKFTKLYDGATTEDELPNFKGLVHADMNGLIARLTTVESQAQTALAQLEQVRGAAEMEEGTEALQQLQQYVSDLLNDVTQVKTFAEESVREFRRVDLVAKVFDSMASEVASFEVAGAFASKMASRLAEAGR